MKPQHTAAAPGLQRIKENHNWLGQKKHELNELNELC